MMTSRGAPDVRAESLASFVELAAAARDGALAKAAAEYREAQLAAESAAATLDAKRHEHDTRQADLDTWGVRLGVNQDDLNIREGEVAAAKNDLLAREVALAARTKQIEEFSAAVGRRDEALKITEAKLEQDAAKLAADTKTKTRQADLAAERVMNKATAEAARITETAAAWAEAAHNALGAELERRRAEFEEGIHARALALATKEQQFNAERARFSALLQG